MGAGVWRGSQISGGSQIVKDSRVATNDEAEADQVAPFFSVSRARGCYDEANDVAEARRLVLADSYWNAPGGGWRLAQGSPQTT